MRRIKDILEQHREKGRFKPVVPRYVPNVAVVSPRPSSDSANVKLKEDGGLAQNTLLDKKKKPMSPSSAEISFQSVKEMDTSMKDEAVNAAQQAAIAINMKKKGIKPKNEQVEELEEMDKSQEPPGRDGGIQFPPGPKVSKKDIKAIKKDPVKHLSDLFAKEYAKKKMKEETSSGEYNDPISRMRKKDNEQKRNNVTDKSGAVHTPMSRARHLAHLAMQKQMEKMKKPVKESLEESRKAQIVKEIMKKKTKTEDTFQKDPELSSSLTKNQ